MEYSAVAAFANCQDCGAFVSRRARACPVCGAPVADGFFSCLLGFAFWFVMLSFVGGVLSSVLSRGRTPKTPPATPVITPSPPPPFAGPFKVGDETILADSTVDHRGVWIGSTLDDMPDLAEAERRLYSGADGGAMRKSMEGAKRATLVNNDSRVRVLEVAPGFRSIEVLDGYSWTVGLKGWVSTSFLHPSAP